MPRFTTVRIGELAVEDVTFTLRLVRDEAGAERLLIGGALSDPDAPLAAVVTWRADLACRDDEDPCPTCEMPVPRWERHAALLCVACVLEATDREGRQLRFTNEGFAGGFLAVRVDTGERVARGGGIECFVRWRRCWADEGRFGGIVVQPYELRTR